MLDSVPEIDMLSHLPEFLDGLFKILSDPRKVRSQLHSPQSLFYDSSQSRHMACTADTARQNTPTTFSIGDSHALPERPERVSPRAHGGAVCQLRGDDAGADCLLLLQRCAALEGAHHRWSHSRHPLLLSLHHHSPSCSVPW